MRVIVIICGIAMSMSTITAQYTGGNADGYGNDHLTSALLTPLYKGENQDGHTLFHYTSPVVSSYLGNKGDGYAGNSYTSENIALYRGDTMDGFSEEAYESTDITMYQGEYQDGFALANQYTKYYWTGAIGTGWNVTGNWSTNKIPSLRHDVFIPANAISWPFVNAGILAIGRDPTDSASYVCNSISIAHMAEMTTRINCFIRNYGDLKVAGSLFVINTQSDALINYGRVLINNGSITIENN